MNKKQVNKVGVLVVVGVFAALIYNTSQVKQQAELAAIEESAILPIILPVQAAELPPLTEEVWAALIPDGIPLLEIAPVDVAELPPLVEDAS